MRSRRELPLHFRIELRVRRLGAVARCCRRPRQRSSEKIPSPMTSEGARSSRREETYCGHYLSADSADYDPRRGPVEDERCRVLCRLLRHVRQGLGDFRPRQPLSTACSTACCDMPAVSPWSKPAPTLNFVPVLRPPTSSAIFGTTLVPTSGSVSDAAEDSGACNRQKVHGAIEA